MAEIDALIALCDQTAVSETTWANTNRLGQFKEKTAKSGDQRQRRKERLERQKRDREKVVDKLRGLDDENEKKVEKTINTNNERTEGRKDKKKVWDEFKDAIMQSEWLVDLPQERHQWYVKVVPYGRRRLLNAELGSTSLYDKRGIQTNRYWSSLPGGGRRNNLNQTLLDGVFNEYTKTFYVLDLLVWDGYEVANCDTEFRFYWLEQKMGDLGWIKGNINIVFIPHVTMDQMDDYLQCDVGELLDVEGTVLVDGVLFYHGETTYTPGSTPLVGWLKPNHLPEQLGIQPHQSYFNVIENDKRVQHQVPEKLNASMN